MSTYEKKPEFQANQASDGSAGTITAVIVALFLVVGAFVLFFNGWNAPSSGPQVTQNNATLPAPVIQVSAARAPAQGTAPAAKTEAPQVNPPSTAPANTP